MDRIAELSRQLNEICPVVEQREGEPLSAHTSFRIGGPARLMLIPPLPEHLRKVLRLCRALELTPVILGNGSNVLAPDQGLDAVVVKVGGGLKDLARLGETELLCGAGVTLARLAAFAQQNSLTGLEFAAGIPGTLGGGLVMNAGAYGGELKDVAEQTWFLTMEGEERFLQGEEQGFGYRRSAFSGGDRVITSARLRLTQGDPEEIRARMEELAARRRASQPLEWPSAGSTFKRPAQGYAAALIDQCGLKGLAVGGAQVSEKHAGFVINRGGATCADVLALTERVRETVLRRAGVELELEVRVLGATGPQ